MYFTQQQIALVNRAFETSEALVMDHFGLREQEWRSTQYEIRTLAGLQQEEVNKSVFAHLCRYCWEGVAIPEPTYKFFYRICLQDDRILDAIDRGKNFIKLYPLLLYISTHELVHLVRFGRGESDFDATPEEKYCEEQRVHTITRNMLKQEGGNNLGLVLDCFSDDYVTVNNALEV